MKVLIISREWYNFQIFADWFDKHHIENFALDKDILVKGNKIYSAETCCFVPTEINNLFTNRRNIRGDYPIGVFLNGKSFIVALRIYEQRKYLGTFSTPEEAFEIYKIAKEVHIKEVAEKWKDKIAENTYQAMYNYKVEIMD